MTQLIGGLFALPFVVVLWTIDFWLFFLAIDLLLRRVKPASQAAAAIAALTNPLIQRIDQLRQRFASSLPRWVALAGVFLAVLIVRSVIIRLIVVLS